MPGMVPIKHNYRHQRYAVDEPGLDDINQAFALSCEQDASQKQVEAPSTRPLV